MQLVAVIWIQLHVTISIIFIILTPDSSIIILNGIQLRKQSEPCLAISLPTSLHVSYYPLEGVVRGSEQNRQNNPCNCQRSR